MNDIHLKHGAVLAPDGIPLHYGAPVLEYEAGLARAVLMDRSHEGRLRVTGRDRLSILQRISTNDVEALSAGEGCPTLLCNANGRIIDRLMVYQRADATLMTTEPGRGAPALDYLRRQIFFNDDIQLHDLAPETRLFALHGPAVTDRVIGWLGESVAADDLRIREAVLAQVSVTLLRRKALSGDHWAVIVPNAAAPAVWQALVEQGVQPAGSLTYNALRIRAGRPAAGRELSLNYIPLEIGLWDEVSFRKGCYTGQEIIARMESRGRLAKTIVRVQLSALVEAPAPVRDHDREVGVLTSAAQMPSGEIRGIAVVRLAAAVPGRTLRTGSPQAPVEARILDRPGAQPEHLLPEADEIAP